MPRMRSFSARPVKDFRQRLALAFCGALLFFQVFSAASSARAEQPVPPETTAESGSTLSLSGESADAEEAGPLEGSSPEAAAGATADEEFIVEEESSEICPACPESRIEIGGYFEGELAVDTRQDSAEEDMIDFRIKLFGHGTYRFSDHLTLRLSIRAFYWLLEGGNDRQQSSYDLYEAYLIFSLPRPAVDLFVGQMLVRWARVGHIFSPTNVVNPINYSSFIDPDTEDLRIPLPMVRAQYTAEDWAVEVLYIPIFQSSVFELTGTDLSLVRGEGKRPSTPAQLNPFLSTFKAYPSRRVDYQEPRIVNGEFALKFSYDTGRSQLELIYFATREDFPVILYTEAKDIIAQPESGRLEMVFDRYQLFGLVYRRNFSGVDFTLELAASPERSLTRWLETDSPSDGLIDRTRRVRRPWQAYAVEMDYLDPNQKYLLKLGVERSSYLDAPDQLLFSSADTTLFLFVLQLRAYNNTVLPEWRVINIQTEANQWFLSPRIAYKFQDKYSAIAGMNIYIGAGGGPGGGNTQEFSPMTIFSDNNQFFFSFRRSF